MFKPGDQVIALWDQVEVASVEGHMVTVLSKEGNAHTVPEHTLHRAPPPPVTFKPRSSSKDLDYQVERKLKTFLQEVPLDWRGHYINGTLWTSTDHWRQPEGKRRKTLVKEAGFRYGHNIVPSEADAQAILAAADAGVALDRFIPVVTGASGYTCPFCPEDQGFETDGLILRPMEPCPHPEGLVTEFDLNVPSGKIILDDDLRYLCRIANEDDINSNWGTHQAILSYANNGLALGFGIGNSSPTVARQKGGKYTIGHRQGGKKIASICTDLWAYSIIDYEEAERRAAYYGIDLKEAISNWSVTIQKIPAGLYHFKHFHGVDRDAAKVLFATFERVGDALPPDDWCAKDKAFQVHITQAVQHQVKSWPTLYGGSRDWVGQCLAVISSEFRGCVPHRDWHRNGHRNSYLRSDIEGLPLKEIPHFRFQGSWEIDRSVIDTAVSRNDELFGGDIPFNESYAIAAGRILESTISFGLQPRHITDDKSPRYDEYTVPEVRASMHKAANLWHGLVKRYPHVAEENPEFHAWMQDEEAVALWIDSYDLGPLKFDREAHKRAQEEEAVRSKRETALTQMQKPGTGVQYIHDTAQIGVTIEVPEVQSGAALRQSPGFVWVEFPHGQVLVELTLLELTQAEVDKEAARMKAVVDAMVAEMRSHLGD